MDEQHLADLAALARLIRDEGGAREEVEAVLDAVAALVDEVTRLREQIRHQAAAWGAEVTRLEGEVARLRTGEGE